MPLLGLLASPSERKNRQILLYLQNGAKKFYYFQKNLNPLAAFPFQGRSAAKEAADHTDRLHMNDNKAEFMIIGTKNQLTKVNIDGLTVGESSIVSRNFS